MQGVRETIMSVCGVCVGGGGEKKCECVGRTYGYKSQC